MTDVTNLGDVELHDAIANLDWFATRLSGIMALRDKMKVLHSSLGAERELQVRLVDLRAEAAKVNEVIAGADAAQHRLDNLNGELRRHAAAMELERAQISESARAEADRVIGDARAKADAFVTEARAAAAAERQAEAVAAAAGIAARKAQLTDLSDEIARRRLVLDQINASIAELRGKIMEAN
jgi:chromosome segregation ATPase